VSDAESLPKVEVACQWSLYPLGVATYMDVIYREIAHTKEAGVFTRGQHFVSRLDGELGDVLGAIRRSFEGACADAGHVVAHVTLSANSPSRKKSS
jgi:energy-coupling factor transport system substrate-specific component